MFVQDFRSITKAAETLLVEKNNFRKIIEGMIKISMVTASTKATFDHVFIQGSNRLDFNNATEMKTGQSARSHVAKY